MNDQKNQSWTERNLNDARLHGFQDRSRPVATSKIRSRRVKSFELKSLRDRATDAPFWP